MYQDDLDLKRSVLADVKLDNSAGTLQALAVTWAAQPDINEEHEAELAAHMALATAGNGEGPGPETKGCRRQEACATVGPS